MSFFNGLIVAREQASGTIIGAVASVTEGDVWVKPHYVGTAKLAWPKRKWQLIKMFLEAELNE